MPCKSTVATYLMTDSSSSHLPCLWGSGVVKKADVSLNLCEGYHGTNAVTVKDRYPLSLIYEPLHKLAGAKVISQLDLRGAYKFPRIAGEEKWKTIFRCRYGHFQYKVMPSASFQSFMVDTLCQYFDITVIVLLDDILIPFAPGSSISNKLKTPSKRSSPPSSGSSLRSAASTRIS